MKQAVLIFYIFFLFSLNASSQPVILPKLKAYYIIDTSLNYYISFCEGYYALFENHNRYFYSQLKIDTCLIDFSKYDLQGTRKNDELKWQLVSPKKYSDMTYDYLRAYDSIDWKIFSQNMIIKDSMAFIALKNKTKQNKFLRTLLILIRQF